MSFNYPSGPVFFGVSVLPSVLYKQQRKVLNSSSLKISKFYYCQCHYANYCYKNNNNFSKSYDLDCLGQPKSIKKNKKKTLSRSLYPKSKKIQGLFKDLPCNLRNFQGKWNSRTFQDCVNPVLCS